MSQALATFSNSPLLGRIFPAGKLDSMIAAAITLRLTAAIILLLIAAPNAPAADYPAPVEGDFIARDFHFQTGESIPELRVHFRTIGRPAPDAAGVVRNAVLVMHGTTGSGASLLRPEFAGELFKPGGLLDAQRCFIIVPDGIGHGKSSKPSDGLHARFPHYAYLDMIEADYRLLTEGLRVNHLRLVMGTSMGGMHTWLWGELHPEFMDALMPLASLPVRMSGRNRVWRKMIMDDIRTDPEWMNGDYTRQPRGLGLAAETLYFMGSNPALRQKDAPTVADSDRLLESAVVNAMKTMDANDVLYALDSSRDYDPGPGLPLIQAPLVAVNSADDLINPPELGILEHEIKKVKHGRAVLLPFSDKTRGHGSHTVATLWEDQLAALLQESTPK